LSNIPKSLIPQFLLDKAPEVDLWIKGFLHLLDFKKRHQTHSKSCTNLYTTNKSEKESWYLGMFANTANNVSMNFSFFIDKKDFSFTLLMAIGHL
jgi:hypothetical protein